MKAHLHQILADASGVGIGFRAESTAQGLNDRIEHAAASSRGRRHGRRNHEFSEANRKAERYGAFADGLDDAKRDASSESGLNEAARQEEGADDEPNRAVTETHQRVLGFQNAEDGAEGERQKCHSAHRNGLQDKSRNRGDENREKRPGVWRKPFGTRQ